VPRKTLTHFFRQEVMSSMKKAGLPVAEYLLSSSSAFSLRRGSFSFASRVAQERRCPGPSTGRTDKNPSPRGPRYPQLGPFIHFFRCRFAQRNARSDGRFPFQSRQMMFNGTRRIGPGESTEMEFQADRTIAYTAEA